MKKYILLILLFISSESFAEGCYYIGCDNMIGYIYVPDGVRYGLQDRDVIKLNNKEYKLEGKENFPFVEKGLPDVNAVVTIANNYISFASYQSIKEAAEKLKTFEDILFNHNEMVASIQLSDVEEFQMTKGSKVKILGYKHFDIPGIEDRLFAQILYISDK
jgi:hypothetical protein